MAIIAGKMYDIVFAHGPCGPDFPDVFIYFAVKSFAENQTWINCNKRLSNIHAPIFSRVKTPDGIKTCGSGQYP